MRKHVRFDAAKSHYFRQLIKSIGVDIMLKNKDVVITTSVELNFNEIEKMYNELKSKIDNNLIKSRTRVDINTTPTGIGPSISITYTENNGTVINTNISDYSCW